MAEVTMTFIHATDDAVLLRDEDMNHQNWFPLSLIDDEFDPQYCEKGEDIDLEIPTWLLEDKGFMT